MRRFRLTWRLNPTRGPNIAGTRDLAEVVRQAFAAWAAVPGASASFSEGSTTSIAAARNRASAWIGPLRTFTGRDVSFNRSGAGRRALHTDDMLGLASLYPAPAFFNSGGAVRGTVRAPSGGSLNSTPVRATEAELFPTVLAFDGRLFFMDLVRGGVLRMDAGGSLGLIVGGFDAISFGDGGPATAAALAYPASMVFDRFGNLFIADTNNNRIRVVRGPIP